jgi:hypothetical protein
VAFDQGRQIGGRFRVAILDHDRPVGEVHYELTAAPPALRVNLGRLHVRVTKPQGQASSFQEYIPVPGLVSHSPIGQLTLRSLDYRRPLRESPYYKGYSFGISVNNGLAKAPTAATGPRSPSEPAGPKAAPVYPPLELFGPLGGLLGRLLGFADPPLTGAYGPLHLTAVALVRSSVLRTALLFVRVHGMCSFLYYGY